jgi:hypothetical protein
LQQQRHRKAVADFATVAEAARLKAIEVEALKAGVMSRPTTPTTTQAKGTTLATAVDQYLAMVEAKRSHRTYISYRYTLKKLLVPSFEKNSVDQVEREDILAFMTRCYEVGLGHRTVYDKLVVVLQLFKRHGKSGLITSSDWPKYVETIRPIYEPEEIQSMFKHATEDEAIFLKFMRALDFAIRRGNMFAGAISISATARFGSPPRLYGTFGRRTGRSESCPCRPASSTSCDD